MMRVGPGGAGNSWVANTASLQGSSERRSALELAVDASPRGTPQSLVSQKRFPSRTKLIKIPGQHTHLRAELHAQPQVHSLPSSAMIDTIKSFLSEEEAANEATTAMAAQENQTARISTPMSMPAFEDEAGMIVVAAMSRHANVTVCIQINEFSIQNDEFVIQTDGF